jgi:DNA adenine methylase
MAEMLSRLQGRFILSLNSVQGVLEAFSKFRIDEVDCTYSIAGGGHGKAVREVIIS